MSIPVDLAILWAFIIAFAVFVYVVMDGFDLGPATKPGWCSAAAA
jgi:cytochrome d ubiquinol oxidase subunit II